MNVKVSMRKNGQTNRSRTTQRLEIKQLYILDET
jgi:hypothetical protein